MKHEIPQLGSCPNCKLPLHPNSQWQSSDFRLIADETPNRIEITFTTTTKCMKCCKWSDETTETVVYDVVRRHEPVARRA